MFSAKVVLERPVQWLTQTSVKDKIKTSVGYAMLLCGLKSISDSAVPLARVSLILNGATCRPGAFLIGKIMHSIYTDNQLQQVFGRNTNYAGNPLHIRHWTSFVAVACALPLIIQTIFKFAMRPLTRNYNSPHLTLAITTLVLTLLSRPVLHQGSLFARKLIAK